MRRSSRMIGTLLSVMLFAGLLCPPPNWSKRMSVDMAGLKETMVSLLQTHPSDVVNAIPEKLSPVSQMVGISVDSNPTKVTSGGDFLSGKSDPGPSINFEWRDADHVLTTADALGLRVVVVGSGGVLGQVVRRGSAITLTTFDASSEDFRQTTRVLPSSFFGAEIAQGVGRPVSEYLVLFPPRVEQAVMELVRSSVEQQKKSMTSIAGVRGELTAVNGRPSFKITHVFEGS